MGQNVEKLLEIGFEQMKLGADTHAAHLGHLNVRAVLVSWVDELCPNLSLDFGIWDLRVACDSASFCEITLVISENHFHDLKLSGVGNLIGAEQGLQDRMLMSLLELVQSRITDRNLVRLQPALGILKVILM